MTDLKAKAAEVAKAGRYGDDVLIHMSAAEVEGLASLMPNGKLPLNPKTGLPEAFFFLPFLAGLGAMAAPAAATGTALTAGLATGAGAAAGLGGLGAGLGAAGTAAGLGAAGTAAGLGAAGTAAGLGGLGAATGAAGAMGTAAMPALTAGGSTALSALPVAGAAGLPSTIAAAPLAGTAATGGGALAATTPLTAASTAAGPGAAAAIPTATVPSATGALSATTAGTAGAGTGVTGAATADLAAGKTGLSGLMGGMDMNKMLTYGAMASMMMPQGGGKKSGGGKKLDKQNYDRGEAVFPEDGGENGGTSEEWDYFPNARYYAGGGLVKGYAAGGIASLQGGGGGEMDDSQLVEATKMALMGQTPNADAIIQMFVQEFGKEALQDLVMRVQQESQGAPMPQGDGMSDSIPAKLSEGEFVVPADAVSGLGNGSTEAGATQLQGMVDRTRQMRNGGVVQPPAMDPRAVMPV